MGDHPHIAHAIQIATPILALAYRYLSLVFVVSGGYPATPHVNSRQEHGDDTGQKNAVGHSSSANGRHGSAEALEPVQIQDVSS